MGRLIRWIQKLFAPKNSEKRCPEEVKCLELVRVMLDKESSTEEDEYVLKHIDNCYQCYDNYDVERAIREAVKQKAQNIQIPDEIINEIKQKIDSQS